MPKHIWDSAIVAIMTKARGVSTPGFGEGKASCCVRPFAEKRGERPGDGMGMRFGQVQRAVPTFFPSACIAREQ
jgi:hypothetical protein